MVLINGVRLFDPSLDLDRDGWIRIEDGRIQEMGFQRPPNCGDTLCLRGLWLTPGFVDTHVHFRDPGQTHKETLTTGAQAAAAGGYTTVVMMANTTPPVDTPEKVRDLYERSKGLPCELLPSACVTQGLKGQQLTDFKALKEAGAVCLTDDGFSIVDQDLAEQAFLQAKQVGLRLSIHPEDPRYGGDRSIHRGILSGQLGLEGVSPLAEEEHLKRDLLLVEKNGSKVMAQHVSTARCVQLIREAKAQGCDVTAEVTPHHLWWTVNDVAELGTNGKMSPPLRTEGDRLAVLEGFLDGTLDCLATDHAPHSKDEKDRSLADAPNGVIGLETAFGALVTLLNREKKMDWRRLIDSLTFRPRQALGLPQVRLQPGSIADLTLFDPEEQWQWMPEQRKSRSQNCPWIGVRLTGKVQGTILRGQIYGRL